MIRFTDRVQAARLLSGLLENFGPDVVVLALRQRAVPIALEITSAIGATAGLLTECPPLQGRTVILVDAGIDDAARDNAVIVALRRQEPARIVITAPVASREASREVARTADECVCLATPHPFHSISFWYDDSARWARSDHLAGVKRSAASRADGSGDEYTLPPPHIS
jgi:predicted phosphoribosyltransferase